MFQKATKQQSKLRLALSGPSGAGKAQPLDSNVLTSTGWRAMGDIRVGDSVIGSDGLVHSVIGVYPQGERPVYQLTMTDGSCLECCAEHLWLTQSPLDRAARRKGSVKSLKQILAMGLKDKHGEYLHYLPMVKPIQFPKIPLPIEPYLLGVILGDGCITQRAVAISNPEKELQIAVADLLPTGTELRPDKSDPGKDFHIRKTGAINPLFHSLITLGLQGCSSTNKFIPEIYLFADLDSRVALLQGLLDTDGYAKGSTLEYGTSSTQLMQAVVSLVESLGGRVTVLTRIPTYSYLEEQRQGQLAYRLFLRLPNEIKPFRLTRKLNSYQPRTKYQPARAIQSIETVGIKPVQCIAVDSPDHLYVTDRFIVTHNTYSALNIAQYLGKTIALLDTEHGSASKYADRFDFDVCNLTDFHPAKYIDLIKAADRAEYEVIVIDSLSHAWYSELELAGKGFDGWKNVRPLERALIDAMLSSCAHVIATMRTKTE